MPAHTAAHKHATPADGGKGGEGFATPTYIKGTNWGSDVAASQAGREGGCIDVGC